MVADHPASAELLKKLQIKSGARMWLVNVPQEIAEALSAGAEVEPVKPEEPRDGVLVFCDSAAELEALVPRLLDGLPRDGVLWIAYREAETGLPGHTGWAPLVAAGWRATGSIAIDEHWTGMRFSPAV